MIPAVLPDGSLPFFLLLLDGKERKIFFLKRRSCQEEVSSAVILMKKALFTEVEQVSFVVSNVMQLISLFRNVYGIGNWKYINFGYLDGDQKFNNNTIKVENGIFAGKYIGTYALQIGQSIIGKTELELIQPLDSKSLFSNYLNIHGPGGQHLAINRKVGFAEMMGIMAENGYPLAQISKIDDIEDCAFIDHMRTFGTYLELHQRPEDFQMPESFRKTEMLQAERTPLFEALTGTSIVVSDLDKALEVLQVKYGIGPWEIQNHTSSTAKSHFIKTAICKSLNIDLILIQPINKETLFYQFLQNNGPGIFDIIFESADPALADRIIEENGRRRTVEYKILENTYYSYNHMDLFGAFLTIRK